MKKDIIGIIDFDLLSTSQLCNFNYGVLLLSSYYLEQGLKVRLIINLSYDNLSKYSKIYIFKDYKTNVMPINLIKSYYSLPVEEYGEGFPNRPDLPDLPNLIYTKLRTDIYKPLLFYINNGGKKFSLGPNWSENYTPTYLFFEKDKEVMLREDPVAKRLLVYDDPLLCFSTTFRRNMMTDLLKRCRIKFVKPLRISALSPKYFDMVLNEPHLVGIKFNLYADESDKYFYKFLDWASANEFTNSEIPVKVGANVKWLKFKGGKNYGNFKDNRFENDDEGRTDDSSSEKNISARSQWFATERYIKTNRPNRDRVSEKERRKYLPSEINRRRGYRKKLYRDKRNWGYK